MKRITDGISYENWCVEYLKKEGYQDISLTRASGDQGIDILARKGRTSYGFQCKFYTSPVGNSAVQEAYSGAAFYNCDQAAVITNTTFTKGARDLAQETGVELWEQVVPYNLHQKKLRLFLSLLTLTSGIVLFVFCVRKPAMEHRITAVLASFVLLAGSVLRCYRKEETERILLSLLADLLAILLLARLPLPQILHGFCLILLIFSMTLSLFHFLFSLKARNKQTGEEIKAELQASIEEETRNLGLHLSDIFSEESGKKIKLKEAHHENGVSTFTFSSSARIREDLALLEYIFNQTQKGSGSPYRGRIQPLSNTDFTLTLTKETKE
jgi:predicted RecB family endonuclease